MKWRRAIIKLSGEALAGPHPHGFHQDSIIKIISEIARIRNMGVRIGVVIGGGNVFRGNMRPEILPRTTADIMGMLATVMNGLALHDIFQSQGIPAEVVSSFPIPGIVESFDRKRVLHALQEGEVIIFSGGLGRPFFTTDTTAAWAALETDSPLVIKATNVDGVYSGHPDRDPGAVLYETLTYEEILAKELGVMDLTAITLLREHGRLLVVLNIRKRGNLEALFAGKNVGTRVTPAVQARR